MSLALSHSIPDFVEPYFEAHNYETLAQIDRFASAAEFCRETQTIKKSLSDAAVVVALRDQGFDVFPVGHNKVEFVHPVAGVSVYSSAAALALELYGPLWSDILLCDNADDENNH